MLTALGFASIGCLFLVGALLHHWKSTHPLPPPLHEHACCEHVLAPASMSKAATRCGCWCHD